MIWNKINNWIEKNPCSKIQDDYSAFTYGTFLAEVEIVASKLSEFFSTGCKCAIFCERNINTGLGILACWKAGLVAIPMSMAYGIEHCKKIVTLTNPDIILSDAIIDNACFEKVPIEVCEILTIKILQLNEFILKEEILSDVALIMCTSGTTGTPKGIMLTHNNLLSNIKDISDYFILFEKDTILIIRPLYHCAALTGEFLLSIFLGVNIFFSNNKYDPFLISNILEKEKITALCGTPTFFNHLARILLLSKTKHHLENIVISGEILRKDVAENIKKIFINVNIFHVYGLTEAAPRVSYLPSHLFSKYPESIGMPLQSVQTSLLAPNGLEQEKGQDGILMVCSPSVMKGYYNNSSLTQAVLKDGWLNTGDIAYMDENGLLYIKSRVDDMIIKGGMNVYPSEIESILKVNKEILDVKAYGQGSSIIVEVLIDAEYTGLSHKDIMQICSRTLPSYLVPDKLIIVDNIDVNATGKRTHGK